MVIRTWPVSNTYEAQPNYFPMLDFDQPDLPWRYTPMAVPSHDRLQPWLCLIVLKDEETRELVPAGETRRLPVVTVSNAPLPDLDQAWAWAHVQVSGVQNIDPAGAAELLAREPHRLVARLLCPRRLDPKTRYTAFLVPTYESGRRAGLGLPVDEQANPGQQAWTPGTNSIQLPIYYHWRFATGQVGDFEELVKRLKTSKLPATVGIRPMDVSDPGALLPAASQSPLGLEGALKARSTESTLWPDAERVSFTQALAQFLNRPTELLQGPEGVRAVAPPLYGRWHAAQDRLAPGEQPVWFQEANSDPRWRAAAGLGAQVIQANQRQLMASAWRQVPGIDEINEQLKWTQLAREVTSRIFERHLASGDDELLLQVTAPVHGRVLVSPVTIAALLRDSPVAEGAVGAGWRRVARPLGAIGRRQGRPPGEQSQILARMNRAKAAERLSPAPPPPTSTKLGTPSHIGQAVVPGWAKLSITDRSLALARRLGQLGTAGPAAAGVFFLLGGRRDLHSPIFVHAVSPRPDFVAVETSITGGKQPGPVVPSIGGNQDSPSAHVFRQAAAVLLQFVEAEMEPEVEPKPVALAELRQKLVDDLDPRRTIGAALQARLQIADGLQWQSVDPLEPILVGPEFPQPMYKPLTELSQDWLLPGLDQVPTNTVTLVKTNQHFVEAYMLGLNHEMGRELFWQEYPTDQRRTYFRQFWDSSGFVPLAGQPLDREKLKDILLIHHWQSSAGLGQNSGRAAATGEQLVLLMRGDVIQRYPYLIVYATRAVWTTDKQRGLGDEERQPVFSGTLKPDIAFFGFALTEEHARGDSTEPGKGDPGWFFVLQEQPGEPRFGLDVGPAGAIRPTKWEDLHWGHLVATGQEQTTIDYINLDADRPDTRAISDPPGVSWHADRGLGSKGAQASDLAFITLQRPVRVAIHAADMLPGTRP
jgi:hypothetical protein